MEPTPKQYLYLLNLALKGGEAPAGLMKPALNAGKDRKPLEAAGFIEVTKKQFNGIGKQVACALLTDRGWSWLGQNIHHKLNPQSRVPLELFQSLTATMATYLQRNEIPLTDFLRGKVNHPSDDIPPGLDSNLHIEDRKGSSLPERIMRSALELGHGKTKTRIRLKDLARKLPDVPKSTLDQQLLELEQQRRIVLYAITMPTDLDDADRANALATPGGDVRHILYVETP